MIDPLTGLHWRSGNRCKGYDYRQEGFYFVTICVKKRIEWFGKIEGENFVPDPIGETVRNCWLAIPEHFPAAVLDEFVVMPNHVHGIVRIVGNKNFCSLRTGSDTNPNSDTKTEFEIEPKNDTEIKSVPWQTKWARSLSSVVRGFKIGVKKWSQENGFVDFTWQKSFHDRIIRDEYEYNRIRRYIQNNPKNWNVDRNNLKKYV